MSPEVRNTAPEKIQEKLRPIGAKGFKFSCHPGVSCFTECCRNLNLLLTPYDVLRLKNRLGLSSGDFLDRFAECGFDEDRNLPLMYLQMNEDELGTCPFVTARGCSVYEDRPSACRIYPVARAARINGVDGSVIENYFLLTEDHCRGFMEDRSWKTDEWLADQGLGQYYKSNDLWMEIVTHPGLRKVNLSPGQQDLFFLGSYDSDRFRDMVFGTHFLRAFEISDDELEKLRNDGSALLELAFRWIRFSLVGAPSMKLRKG